MNHARPFTKAATSGVIAATASYATLQSGNFILPFINKSINSNVMIGLLAAGSTYIGGNVREYLLPHFDDSRIDATAMMVSPAITGSLLIIGATILNRGKLMSMSTNLKLFLIGAVSEGASIYVNNNLLGMVSKNNGSMRRRNFLM